MGLNTSHGCWDGAYSAFNRWRNKIAEVSGWTFADETILESKQIHNDMHPKDWVTGRWHREPIDPLLIILCHSDCDGYIRKKHCKPLADALSEILPKLPDEDGGGHIGSLREKTQQFIDGLLYAHDCGERVEFR